MTCPATPPNQEERLAALGRYEILDSPDEAEFDDVATLVATLCDTPIAAVNFIARDRQWFKAEVGLGVKETPLESSLCAHAILQPDVLVVPDTRRDPRFEDNPLVTGEPFLRFYAGALLKTPDGFPLGTLCVLDTRPRALNGAQLTALRMLANQIMSVLELRRAVVRQAELNRQVEAALTGQRRLLATVSHDLRTPLATVRMAAELLDELAPEGPLEGLGRRLARAADSMIRLTDDLLDQESLAQGTLSMRRTLSPLTPILEALIERFAPIANEAGITLRCDFQEPLAAVHCDPDRLSQAVGNLLSNALAFTPRGGEVTLGATRTSEGVRLTVLDSGPGIRDSDLTELFAPFWRAEGASGKGMGLGLSIVRSLIEAHSGHVTASNRPEGGAVFEVTLPCGPVL